MAKAEKTHRDEFEATLAELSNTVSSVYGYAEMLAVKHRPELVEKLKRSRERYMALVKRLSELHYGRAGE